MPSNVLTFKYEHGQVFFLVLMTDSSVRFFHDTHLYHIAPYLIPECLRLHINLQSHMFDHPKY